MSTAVPATVSAVAAGAPTHIVTTSVGTPIPGSAGIAGRICRGRGRDRALTTTTTDGAARWPVLRICVRRAHHLHLLLLPPSVSSPDVHAAYCEGNGDEQDADDDDDGNDGAADGSPPGLHRVPGVIVIGIEVALEEGCCGVIVYSTYC